MSDDRYRALRFLFKVDYIEPDYGSLKFDGDGLWFPKDRGAFETLYSTGWLQRTPERVAPAVDHGEGDFAVCSLLYRSSTSYFFTVPVDCRDKISMQNHIQRTHHSWRRLRFKTDERQNLSIATFAASGYTLAGRGSRDWVPEILPDTYNDSYCSQIPFTHLTGDLALIVGLVAFSCPRERDGSCLIDMMQRCFRPPRWVPHRSVPERIDRHGVVVTIRADPEAGDMHESNRELQRFQDGSYGALFKSPDGHRF
ncbi:hypothetical protein McanMca71_002881 [Microsporum canis]|uniref:Uncharacterized protein n=1 Tax=Arthroderma otae (strain ATCC MYA-4605 / CBS 113480) TaxID=554155 RepID=C5FVI8_ARTOC|nr:conserved hypothetical protein [Microsporum canis CBS 113480]EEQ33922.1 conserved hypothetical protein [Microsporum canis CBS 113480]